MYFAYVDETGDPGTPHAENPGSKDYTLGVVMVSEESWTRALDEFISFRRRLRSSFGIPMRTEIKAHYLVNNKGWFKGRHLSTKQRRYILDQHLRLVSVMQAKAFAVHVDKQRLMDPRLTHASAPDPRERSWTFLFQRFAIIYERSDSQRLTPIHLSHDEGNNAYIKKLARKARRFLTAGQLYGSASVRLPTDWLIDDPVPRNSAESYFIQLADIVAWTASRTLLAPGASGRRVLPAWSALGAGCYVEVNQQAVRRDPTTPPGIVVVRR